MTTPEEAAARRAAKPTGTKTWRFTADNVRDVATGDGAALAHELDALGGWIPSGLHPYLAGGASDKIAAVLGTCDLSRHGLAKRNTF